MKLDDRFDYMKNYGKRPENGPTNDPPTSDPFFWKSGGSSFLMTSIKRVDHLYSKLLCIDFRRRLSLT